MPKAGRVAVALSVSTVLFLVFGLCLVGSQSLPAVSAQDGTYNTLRVYGRANQGAGETELIKSYTERFGAVRAGVRDPETNLPPEDPPYTEPEPIFNPQLDQAPIKDSLTFNPAFMSEFETLDENHALGLYNQIFAGARNATEKVWFRMWYEPWHWDKDLNADSVLTIDDTRADGLVPYPAGDRDEWYPAVMQEFTYMLLEADLLRNKPEPLAGQVGRTSFVFPIGMRKADLFKADGSIDMDSANARYGYGLTSLDADFDGVPDIVYVESELSLFDKTRIAADFDGDRVIDALDDGVADFSGNELAVLRTGSKALGVGKAIQFLDHLAIVRSVFNDSVLLDIWYLGDMVPVYLGNRTIYVGDMLLSGNSGPGQHIRSLDNGGPGTNACDFPTGPWFVFLDSIDQAENKARLMVGRALGATYSSMEQAAQQTDTRPGDPWFLKRFYVDGHEYNVVAIKTEGGIAPYQVPCTLLPTSWDNRVIDGTRFKFITIRTPIPKEGTYDDPLTGYLIEQHSVRLQPYGLEDLLSVLPPFNHEHYIIMDVQALEEFTCDEEDVDYFGQLVGPVPPILQQNGPFPYQGVGKYSPYTERREMSLFYVEEAKNPQFLGELKEKYGQEDDASGQPELEFWYTEQFHTLPWEYTEFVLPDLGERFTATSEDPDLADLYLLTSSFLAEEGEYVLWTKDVITDNTSTYNLVWDPEEECWVREFGASNVDMPGDWSPRVKFWFDPGEGGKKYKDDEGIRLYGFDNEGPGDLQAVDPGDPDFPVEVKPYTDPWAPFNPQFLQAPPKDSLTFNPAYMNEFLHGNESLAALYRLISIREQNAYEKVFFRMWYEPEYLDKVLQAEDSPPFTPTVAYTFPAAMQEFTYMYLDTRDQPASAQPKSSAFAFPMATDAAKLPRPDPVTGALPTGNLPSFGYGLTSFDANFDGQQDIVHLHSELSLQSVTNITATFDGDPVIDLLDQDGQQLSGDELVIFALEDMVLSKGGSVQFLDHMVTLDDVVNDRAVLKLWYTGGGIHSVSGGYSLHPDVIDTRSLQPKEMAIVNRSGVRVLPAGGDNRATWNGDGAWFVYVNSISDSSETASLMIGRALGGAYSAMDDGDGEHDLVRGDPWYLKRFFVDGHEYNVVAVHVVRGQNLNQGDERYEFKYITIRTPVPKVNFINREDSQKLEGYYLGTVWGEDSSIISVMPPFNFEHTCLEDVQALSEKGVADTNCTGERELYMFGNWRFYDSSQWCPPVDGCYNCRGPVMKNKPPYEIRIVDEDVEPQFFGELKEKYYESYDASGVYSGEIWQTEQFHIVPDQYTEFELPLGQKYLLTSNWLSPQERLHYYGCGPDGCIDQVELSQMNGEIPAWNVDFSIPQHALFPARYRFYDAQDARPARVKFWYDPADPKDLYVNTWQGTGPGPTPTPTPSPTPPPGGTGTITGKVMLQGRTNYAGATVCAAGACGTTNAAGFFTLSAVPVGNHQLVAEKAGYLDHVKASVLVEADEILVVPDVQLTGGDANNDCLINVFDLVIVAWNYGSSPPTDPRADINGNNLVDIFDLVMVGRNLDQACPGPWLVPMGALDAATAADVHALPAGPILAPVGGLFKVTVQIDQATSLYGADATLTFDPAVLEVVDQDAVTPGVQILGGTFLNPAEGTVAVNDADNTAGTVQYAVALKSPAAPVNGSGVLCEITFRALAEGTTDLAFGDVTLADDEAAAIDVTVYDSSAQVSASFSNVYMPLVIKAAPR